MAAFSVATGLTLLYDEGVLPPNPTRQALAFTSPADAAKLGSEGLAFKTTATALAMDDESANGNAVLSSTAMQFLVQNLATPEIATESSAGGTALQQSGYPYGGWSSVPTAATEESATTAATSAAPIDLLA